MKSKQLNQILILVVLLVIIGVANYYNYYKVNKKEIPLLPEYSFDALSPEEQKRLIDIDNKAANGEILTPEQVENDKKQIDGNNENYLIYAVDTTGKLVRWNKREINVYVANTKYKNALYDALSEYNKVFNGFFVFSLSNAGNADITIEVVDKFDSNEKSNENYMAGITNNVFSGKNELSAARIRLLSVKPFSNKKVSDYEIYTVLMHELGHALGIIGHSPNKKDVMYAFSESSKGVLTHRDINTIKMMYSNDEELIKRETIGFADKKISEAQKYVKLTSDKALGWINLGKLYYDNGKKVEALNAYKKALVLEPNNPDIYNSMAECYYFSEKYDVAIKYYNFAIEKSQSTQELAPLYNMIGMCYVKKEDLENAHRYFEQSFQYAQNNKMYLHNLLTMCVELGYKSEALRYINLYKSTGASISNDEVVQKILKWAQTN